MENITEIIQKYFKKENIQNVQNIEGHVIVTLANIDEDTSKAKDLKEELLALDGIHRVNVVFTAQKQNSLNNTPSKWQIKGVKKIIGVASGKGGVGKSTTAVNLALALSKLGKSVAIFDADIYGPSLPTMLSFENTPPTTLDGKTFEPFESFGIKAMSIGSLIDRDTPLLWRGPKTSGALKQLLTETNWGKIDVMVIDMPPGTGDIQITLSENVDFTGIVIVSTPQDVALIDAVKGVNAFEKIGVPILGVIENMSYYICPHCAQKAYIFGAHGAAEMADRLGQRFLGEIPIDTSIRENADQGTPIVISSPQNPSAKAYQEIASKLLNNL